MLEKKVIAPSKPSPTLSSGASIETDGAHTLLDVLCWVLFSLPNSFQPGKPLRHIQQELGLPCCLLFTQGGKSNCMVSCTYRHTSLLRTLTHPPSLEIHYDIIKPMKYSLLQ